MRILVFSLSNALKQLIKLFEVCGFAVDGCERFDQVPQRLEKHDYDACLLNFDSSKSKEAELSIIDELRTIQKHTKILVLLPQKIEYHPAKAFYHGADDFLVSPYDETELIERVRALCRRKYSIHKPVIKIQDLTVDCTNRTAERGGRSIELTPREFALLEYLAIRSGQVVSREDIWNHVYDAYDQVSSSNVVDVYIGYLRKKLENPHTPKILHTRRGHGYVLGDSNH